MLDFAFANGGKTIVAADDTAGTALLYEIPSGRPAGLANDETGLPYAVAVAPSVQP